MLLNLFQLFCSRGRVLPLLLVALFGGDAVGQVTLHGHVRDQASGLPISDAVVEIKGVTPVLTCKHGAFTIAVDTARYDLVVRHLGYRLSRTPLEVHADTHVDVWLEPIRIRLDAVVIAGSAEPMSNGLIQPVEVFPGPEQFTNDVNLHLGAMLRSVPGVSSVNTGASAGLPWIRGLGGNRVGVFVEGVPQQNQQWAVDHGTDLDPWMAERIAVYRGPATLRYGANASAGVIDIRAAPMLEERSLSVGAFTRAQRVNDGIEGGLRYRQRFRKLQVEARVVAREFADYRVPADEFIHLNRILPIYDNRLVNTSGTMNSQQIRLRYDAVNEGFRVEARRSQQVNGIFPGIFGIPTIPRLSGDGLPRETALPRMESLHETASVHYYKGNELARFSMTAGWQHSNRKELGPPHTHGNRPLPQTPLAIELDMHAFFASTHFEKSVGSDAKWFGGAQIEHLNSVSSGWEFLVSDYTTTTAGGYFGREGLLHVLGGRLDGGVRGDFAVVRSTPYAELLYDSNQQIIGSTLLSSATDELFPGVSASLSWARNYDSHHQLSVQLARTIRFPSAYELSANGVHHGTFRHEQGNPTLRTETGYQLDVRLSGYVDRLSWEVSPFLGYYDNFLYLGPSAMFSFLPHAGQLYRFRQSDVIRTGGELLARYRVSGSLSVLVTAEYLVQYNLDEGMSLPFTPPFKTECSANWQPFLKFGNETYLRTGYAFVASQNWVDRNEPPTEQYALLNLAFGGRFGAFQWSVFVNNVFDRVYIDHLSRYKLLNLPEPGRNAGILLLYEFNHSHT